MIAEALVLTYFFVKFCVGGINHVLLLQGRVYKVGVMMFIVTLVVVHTDTFCKNEFHLFFTNTFAKMDKFRGGVRERLHKFMHAAKVLEISVFTSLLDNGLIGMLRKCLRIAGRTSDGRVWPGYLTVVKREESFLEHMPIDLVREFVQRMLLV